MNHIAPRPRWHRWLTRIAQVVAVGAGLVVGYGFGAQLAGAPLGVVTAISSALFCAVAVDGIADWMLQGRTQRREPD